MRSLLFLMYGLSAAAAFFGLDDGHGSGELASVYEETFTESGESGESVGTSASQAGESVDTSISQADESGAAKSSAQATGQSRGHAESAASDRKVNPKPKEKEESEK